MAGSLIWNMQKKKNFIFFFMLGGCNIEGEDESWDFGTGAGFYVDATEDPWKTNYRMYSYIKDEVSLLLASPG